MSHGAAGRIAVVGAHCVGKTAVQFYPRRDVVEERCCHHGCFSIVSPRRREKEKDRRYDGIGRETNVDRTERERDML